MVPSPSSSARVLAAVRTSSSAAVPEMVTEPVGSSSTLATAVVAALVELSAVPWPSVYAAVTVIVLPTSDWPRVVVEPVSPLLHV